LTLYDRVAHLPVTIEGYALERLELGVSSGDGPAVSSLARAPAPTGFRWG
jgi:hypothetical protein